VGALDAFAQVTEERTLAHTGLASENEDAALTSANIVRQLIEHSTLGPTPEEPHERSAPSGGVPFEATVYLPPVDGVGLLEG
jgi:hypothetical protein